MLNQAIKELSKRPQTNKGVLFALYEHQHRLERLEAAVEVILEQHKKGAVQPYYFMALEEKWLALKQL